MAAPNSQTTPNSQSLFSNLQQVGIIAQTITPGSVATVVAAEQTFTVTGLAVGDVVFVSPAATGNATGVCSARVTAANTLGITFVNPTAGALTPGAGTYLIAVFRPAPGIGNLTAMPIL